MFQTELPQICWGDKNITVVGKEERNDEVLIWM